MFQTNLRLIYNLLNIFLILLLSKLENMISKLFRQHYTKYFYSVPFIQSRRNSKSFNRNIFVKLDTEVLPQNYFQPIFPLAYPKSLSNFFLHEGQILF